MVPMKSHSAHKFHWRQTASVSSKTKDSENGAHSQYFDSLGKRSQYAIRPPRNTGWWIGVDMATTWPPSWHCHSAPLWDYQIVSSSVISQSITRGGWLVGFLRSADSVNCHLMGCAPSSAGRLIKGWSEGAMIHWHWQNPQALEFVTALAVLLAPRLTLA